MTVRIDSHPRLPLDVSLVEINVIVMAGINDLYIDLLPLNAHC